jgi:hypothetical protein
MHVCEELVHACFGFVKGISLIQKNSFEHLFWNAIAKQGLKVLGSHRTTYTHRRELKSMNLLIWLIYNFDVLRFMTRTNKPWMWFQSPHQLGSSNGIFKMF